MDIPVEFYSINLWPLSPKYVYWVELHINAAQWSVMMLLRRIPFQFASSTLKGFQLHAIIPRRD